MTREDKMRHPFRKVVFTLTAAVMLMFFVAAGIDTASLSLTEVIGRSLVNTNNHYLVMAGLVSMWVLTIGLMCRTLKNIPGIKPKGDKVDKFSSKA